MTSQKYCYEGDTISNRSVYLEYQMTITPQTELLKIVSKRVLMTVQLTVSLVGDFCGWEEGPNSKVSVTHVNDKSRLKAKVQLKYHFAFYSPAALLLWHFILVLWDFSRRLDFKIFEIK